MSVLKGNQGSKERHLCLICSQTPDLSLTVTSLNGQPGIFYTNSSICLFVKIRSHNVTGRPRTSHIEQVDPELTEILLPLPPKCWN